MPEITTTLSAIRRCDPCREGWTKLLRHLGKTAPDDEPLRFRTIYESNGPDDMLWCLRSICPPHDALCRHLAVDFAATQWALLADERSRNALRVVRRYASGEASGQELDAARVAAGDAAKAAAWAAAWDAAWDAAKAAAWAAAWAAARDARDAAWAAAGAAAGDAAFEAHAERALAVLEAGKWTPLPGCPVSADTAGKGEAA